MLGPAVFALAASAATLAGAGLAIVPHHHPASAAPDDHPREAYRLPLLPLVEHVHHHALASAPGEVGPSFAAADDQTGGEATLLLVSLARIVPRLPRPSLRAVAEFVALRLDDPQWWCATPTGPPRAV